MSNTLSKDTIQLHNSFSTQENRLFSRFLSKKVDDSSSSGKRIQKILKELRGQRFEAWFNKHSASDKQRISRSLYILQQHAREFLLIHEDNPMKSLEDELAYTRVLTERGMLPKATKLLAQLKAKLIPMEHWQLLLSVIDQERNLILTNLNAPDLEERLNALNQEKADVLQTIEEERTIQSLCDRLTPLLVQRGHVDANLHSKVMAITKDSALREGRTFRSSRAEAFYHFFYSAYHYLKGDFENAMNSSEQRLRVFEKNTGLITHQPRIYLSSVNNYIVTANQNERWDKVEEWVNRLKELPESTLRQFPQKDQVYYYERMYYSQLELDLKQLRINDALAYIPDIEVFIRKHELRITVYSRIILFYHLALCFYYAGKLRRAGAYTANIILSAPEHIRADYVSAAYILNLIVDLENEDPLLSNTIQQTTSYFQKKRPENDVEAFIFASLTSRKTLSKLQSRVGIEELQREFKNVIAASNIQSSLLRYFDLVTWLEARVQGVPMVKVLSQA